MDASGWHKNFNDIKSSIKTVILDLFSVFLFPVRVKNKCAENQSSNDTNNENEDELIHYCSPPLKYVPIPTNSINKIPPIIAKNQENFSGTAILATINATKTACAKLRKTLANPSFCRLLNFTNNIISEIKTFVKLTYYIYC